MAGWTASLWIGRGTADWSRCDVLVPASNRHRRVFFGTVDLQQGFLFFFFYLQVKAVSVWSQSEELNETKVELRQPFTSTLGHMSFHTLSQISLREQLSSQQVHLCLNDKKHLKLN